MFTFSSDIERFMRNVYGDQYHLGLASFFDEIASYEQIAINAASKKIEDLTSENEGLRSDIAKLQEELEQCEKVW